ncbi:mucin-17-like [Scyliorhinus canicula]|uniref:mucin-17-like n=1 Tax=Scyliorhinus canicula TaxID=7830 RepID=UPI0018F3E1F0|nr:mucin-17-like [Scyliorhinus canicula]
MVTGVMEAAADDPWSEPQRNPPPSAPSGGTKQKALHKDSLDRSSQRAARKVSARTRDPRADETAAEEAVADCPSPCDGDSGEELAADTPGSSDGDTEEDPAADSTGDTDEESTASSTGEESAADSKGLNDSGEESTADSTGPSDGDTVEGSTADSPGPCDGDTVEGSAADSPGPCDGDTVEGSAADSPGSCDGDTVEGSAADSPGPCDGDTMEGSAADSPGPCDGDTMEGSAADSPGPCDGDTMEGSAADSPGPCDGDTMEGSAADSPGPCDGDTVEGSVADSPGPCDGDTMEGSAADSPGPCDGDTVEGSVADSPGPCDGDTMEASAADSPGPCDGDTVEGSAADSPGPCDGDTVEASAADSSGPCDNDTFLNTAADSTGPIDGIREEAAADSPGLYDTDTIEQTAASSLGPCDTETVGGTADGSPGPCDTDTVGGIADGSPGPCDTDTVGGTADGSPGPCDTDTVGGMADGSPGPCDTDTVGGMADGSPGPCDTDTVGGMADGSPGPCDTDTVGGMADGSPGPCDTDTVGGMADGSPGPCDTDTVGGMADGSPGPCDTDTVEGTSSGSPGPCDTDTVMEMVASTPGPCDTDTVETTAAGSTGPCDTDTGSPGPCDGDTVASGSPHDPNAVGKQAAESPSRSGGERTFGELPENPNLPCEQSAATQMEIDGPNVDGDTAEESAIECATAAGAGLDTAGELAAHSSFSTVVQGAAVQLPESSDGPEHTVDKTLAGSDYTTTEGASAGLDEYGQGSSEYGLMESEGSIPPYPADFEKYWKIVEDNPYDFTGWTYILQYVEQENHVWAVRKAFDAFFTRYPYCYGYWKKYADIEKRLGFTKEAEEVYQRGLQSIPLSVDLWVHYITYLQEILEASNLETPAKLRSVFEMALAAAGTDFRSDRLWDLYVNWEKEQGQLKAVTAIYERVLLIPTQLYSHHFEKFKEHVQSYSPKDILSTDEFLRLRSEVVSSLATAEAEFDEGPPGDDPPPGVGTTDQEKADTELEKIRAHLMTTRHELYLLNEEEVSKRWNFEEAIKRPYFHVKPLERVQLKNWKDYLDFEIAGGTNERVLVLFERCMIACALYEDFWIKYAKYLENHSVEGVRNVFQRACMVHLPKKPTLHLLWAAFEEQQGDLEEARRILKSFQMVVPGLAMVLLRRVSLERRCGHLEQAEELLREAIEQHRDTALASFFAIKLARQLLKVQKSLAKARKVLLEAVERDKENTKLYLNLLELEFSGDIRVNEGNILGCFEQVLTSSLPLETKIVFSQRRVEFLEDFGYNVQTLLHAYDEHQRLLKQNSSKKRAAENGTEEPEGEGKQDWMTRSTVQHRERVPATTTNSTALMSGDVTSSQAAYNYSAWYQPYGSYGYQNPWNYSQYYPQS